MDFSVKLEEFLREKYEAEILKAKKEGRPSITIDFQNLDKYDLVLADQLLENPQSILSDLKTAVISIADEVVTVRIKNLPASRNIRIRNLRAEHLNKFWIIDCTVKSASEVKPQIYEVSYECPSCGTILNVRQESGLLQKPEVCDCGRRGDFKNVSKKMFDIRWLNAIEPFEVTTGEQPGEITIFLKEDLTTPKMQKLTDPGSRLRIYGVLRELPKRIKGRLSTRMDMYIEASFVESAEIEYEDLEITEENKLEIVKLASDPNIYEKLKASIAPGIYGFDEIKEALMLQLFGGIPHKLPDGSRIRGNVHILITGDPGTGKSQMLKLISSVVPRGRYVSGSGVSGAGLCTAYDTLIQLGNGRLTEIGKIVEKKMEKGREKIDDGIWVTEGDGEDVLALAKDFKIKPKKITKYWKLRSPEKLVQITTVSGRKIKVTEENPMPLLSENGVIFWKPANKIRKNDHLATPRMLAGANSNTSTLDSIDYSARLVNSENIVNEIIGKIKSVDTIRDFAKKHGIGENSLYHDWRGHKAPNLSALEKLCKVLDIDMKELLPEEMILEQYMGHKIKMPKNLNKEIMYLFGLTAGDGSISKTEFNGRDIKFCSAEHDLLKRFTQLSEKHFGIRPKYYKHPERIAYVRFSSKLIGNLAESFGICTGVKAHKLRVTEKLSELPDSMLASYLCGLFDTDGYVAFRKTRGSNVIGFDTVSEKFARGVQIILLRFGVMSSIRKRKPHTSEIRGRKVISGERWSLEIRGIENMRKFKENIGFSLIRKNEVLQKLFLKYKEPNTNTDIIPHIGSLLRIARTKAGISAAKLYGYKTYACEKGRINPSRIWLAEKVEMLNKKTDCSEVNRLSTLAHSDILWDKVKDVAYVSGGDYVYDITVEEEHSFVANGMIIHNTATVRKDENLGSWVLEAGALILCNRGLISIDEFDKMNRDDQIAMHEAMSLESVSIAKASIVATLPAETAVLAGANPKHGRFDPGLSVAEQIQIPETLLSRFDLKFALKDKPDRGQDERVAEHILISREKPELIEPVIPIKMLKKYLAYARQIKDLELSEEAGIALKNFYVDMRNRYVSDETQTISITLRQYEALIRLAEASAKIRLDTKVRMEDAERAINLMRYSLSQLGTDMETGRIDIDKVEGGVTASKRRKITIILDIITELQKSGEVAVEDVRAEAESQGVENVDEVLDRLKREGTIFEPKSGFIRKV